LYHSWWAHRFQANKHCCWLYSNKSSIESLVFIVYCCIWPPFWQTGRRVWWGLGHLESECPSHGVVTACSCLQVPWPDFGISQETGKMRISG
jgi:hypothetical protein